MQKFSIQRLGLENHTAARFDSGANKGGSFPRGAGTWRGPTGTPTHFNQSLKGWGGGNPSDKRPQLVEGIFLKPTPFIRPSPGGGKQGAGPGPSGEVGGRPRP